jgi:hypothetical protein
MFKLGMLTVLSSVALLLVAVGVATAGDGATVTKATLASFWEVSPMTCDEVQVINASGRRESFHCKLLPAPGGKAQVIDCGTTEGTAEWFSDFDGAQAVSCHLTIAPNGNFEGWAQF